MSAEQVFHQVKQLAAQQDIDQRFFVFGHVAQYDASRHMVQVIVPSWRDGQGRPAQTGWIQLGSPGVGAGFGLQIAPFGGATFANPTAGEQVLVELVDRVRGVAVSATLFYSNAMLPPSTALATPLAAGEAVLRHQSGSFVRLYANGDVEINAAGNLTATVAGTASIVAPLVQLTKALSDTLQKLCTAAFASWAENHVHSDPQGGVTGVPTTAPPSNGLTSVLMAE